MKPLSGLDATFLYLETPETPMHVGSFCLYELPPGFKGSFHRAVKEHIARRMHLAPIFTRRLAFMPFDLGHPIWVEADQVDLDFHIHKAPGRRLTVRQAEAAAAKLHSRLIDREHPLWEFHIFDDIRPPADMPHAGRLAGFYSKIHHAALDGKGGTVLANAILDIGPTPREVAPPDDAGRPRKASELKIGEMIGAVFSNSLVQYAKLARSLPAAASSLGGTIARRSVRGGGDGLRARMPLQLAPRTIFNVGITPQRAFATATLPFAECKALAKNVGGSFNDIVLWICATALRDYLARHGTLPKKPLVAAMPVSLREESNKELNNQASITVVQLGTHIGNPLKRMNAILESTAKVKEALAGLKSVLPTDYPSLFAPWLVGGAGKAVFRTYGRSGITERLPAIANLAISNVPGPQVPLYLAGARMVTFHPLSIVMHGLALNITIQTYAGRVDFGIIADRKAVPHVHDLASALEHAFEEAKGLFAAPDVQAPETKPPRKKPAKKAATKAPAGVARKRAAVAEAA
ncbi:MAG TPA: wax ester/triacylglycerol synthase family O-acyltransferase [Ramlibacter sp.]|uniref:wax ester/triacylglycerol synthase family O-acyltransferase n=1 Tax=Ramlibacter sp. TaxID=1917967 RepID=UPI002CE6A0B4|nr:wax ester/triacylglycerol synthase family O-acyltransferase [Ramlibacter sp.]HVZ44661.1 wax ester/triacylglycerol synthase family O-acyltransferase [Ramlibacter sp.]